MHRDLLGLHRVGQDSNSSVASVSVQAHRIHSQDSSRGYSTSQLSSSLEDSPLDGGRSHARFQEFVSRTRHMELIEILHELKTKICSLEVKVDALKQIQHHHPPLPTEKQFNDLIEHSASEKIVLSCLGANVQKLNEEIQTNSQKLEQLARDLNHRKKYQAQEVFVSEKEIKSASAKDEDLFSEEDDGISLSQYLHHKRSATPQVINFAYAHYLHYIKLTLMTSDRRLNG
jgi:hypothetical protein